MAQYVMSLLKVGDDKPSAARGLAVFSVFNP